jgi:hypothetical protein
MAWRAEHGINTQEDVERATTPHSDTETVHNASHKAGRYKRRGVNVQYMRTIPWNDKTLKSYVGRLGSPTKQDYNVAYTLADWLEDHEDWRHHLLRKIAAPERRVRTEPHEWDVPQHLPDQAARLNSFHRRKADGLGAWTFRAEEHTSTGEVRPTTRVFHVPSGHHVSFVTWQRSETGDPVVTIDTTMIGKNPKGNQAPQRFTSIFTPEEYGALRHDAGTAGVEFPEPPASHTPPVEPERLSRRRFSLAPRGDFIDSLRRIRSSNQKVLHDVAQKVGKQLGLTPVRTYDGLYDTQRGSVPGIVQAVYGRADPTKVHAAAAWPALIGNGRGTAVFHVRPTGVDTLYKLKHPGSGLEIRDKLDRAGIPARVLMLPADPGFAGFDVLIPDRGSKIGRQVADYARRQGIKVQASRGHMTTAGSADQGKTRAKMRDAVARSEG